MATNTLHVERLADSERGQAAERTALWLGLEHASDCAQTWPQMFGPRADTRHYVIRADSKIVAHAAARSVRIALGSDRVAAELIGGVGTDLTHRGRGHASALLEAIEQDAIRFRSRALVLWSELHDFYHRFGFIPTGEQWELGYAEAAITEDLQPRLQALASKARIRSATPTDFPAIYELHARNPVGVQRSLVDIDTLWSTDPMHCVVAERGGQPVAYGCRDKGADLGGWWHEFGGSDADVAAILLDQTQGAQHAHLLLPGYRPDLLSALVDERTVATVTTGCCALTRSIGDAPSVHWLDDLFIDGLDSI